MQGVINVVVRAAMLHLATLEEVNSREPVLINTPTWHKQVANRRKKGMILT